MERGPDRQIAARPILPPLPPPNTRPPTAQPLPPHVELNRIFLLRNFLADMPATDAIEFLLGRMEKTESNAEFLDAMTRGE